MSRMAVVVLAILLSTSAEAQNYSNGWLVSADCFVSRVIGSGDFDNVADVTIAAIFDSERYLRKSWPDTASAIDVKGSNPQIQIVPPFPSWYFLKGDRFAVTIDSESAIPLVRDASFDSDPRPRFDFIGTAAEELSRKLSDGKEIRLNIQYDLDEETTVSLASAEIAAGWTMLESCLSKEHQDEEQ